MHMHTQCFMAVQYKCYIKNGSYIHKCLCYYYIKRHIEQGVISGILKRINHSEQ